jgi:hypothetical protein
MRSIRVIAMPCEVVVMELLEPPGAASLSGWLHAPYRVKAAAIGMTSFTP